MKALLACAALTLASCVDLEDLPGTCPEGSGLVDPPTDWSTVKGKERNVAWKAGIGTYSYAPPVVADGLVWVGTGTDARPEAGLLLCFRESDGKLLWRHEIPRRMDLAPEAQGYFTTLRSPPLVDGERLWILDNRWEVVCFDIGPLKRETGSPRELWRTDLIRETGARPMIPGMGWWQGGSIGAPYRGMIYVSTGNGIGWASGKMESPDAPALVCLDAAGGQVLGREDSGISRRTVSANRSSPTTATFQDADHRDRTLVLYGGGDGFLYAFDPVPIDDPRHPGSRILKEVWKVDCNPEAAQAGKRELLGISAAPLVHDGRVYAVLGTDLDESGSPGNLCCIDGVTGHKLWTFDTFFSSTVAPLVWKDRVLAADNQGLVYCLDVANGNLLWKHDALAQISVRPLLAHGLLYVLTGDQELLILDARAEPSRAPEGRIEKRVVAVRPGPQASFGMAMVHRTLFFAARNELCAIRQRREVDNTEKEDAVSRGRALDALFVPTPRDVVDVMLELVALRENDLVYDLGSGDGRIVIAAAGREGCHAVGIEIDPDLVEKSRQEIRSRKLETRARIDHEDLLKADFSDATVVTLYLGERLNRLLIPKLQALKPGTRIVSHQYGIPGAPPDQVLHVTSQEDGRDHAIFLLKTPLRLTPEGN